MNAVVSITEEALLERLGSCVTSWGSAELFEDLAPQLFTYQYERNAPYRRFCDFRGVTPAALERWDQIPAVPAEAFRTQVLHCSPEPPAAVFHTSGTTSGSGAPARGAHYMSPLALDLYRLSLQTAFARLAGRAAGLPIRALLAPYVEAPDSSLSFMVSTLAAAVPTRFFWKETGPDLEAARESLAQEHQPILLFTTAFALAELLDCLDEPIALPAGSILIETGGFKGRRKAMEREELYGRAAEGLGLAQSHIGSEYGMCEMASQFYDLYLGEGDDTEPGAADAGPGAAGPGSAVRDRESAAGDSLPSPVKVGPPWVRTVLIDPTSGEPAAPGQPGLLRHFDLANLNSVLAIQTMDVGIPGPGGTGFLLQGRLPGAPPRGCSLTIEEWKERQ